VSLLQAAAGWLLEPAPPGPGTADSCERPDRRIAAGHLELARAAPRLSPPRPLAAPAPATAPPTRITAPPTLTPAPDTATTTPAPLAALSPLVRPAVLGTAATAPPLAAAVALACRCRVRVSTALVALWPADGAPGAIRSGPALPGAAALAARLHRRDLPVTSRGRLVWLALAIDAEEAATMLRHAEAAAGDVPTVLAVARPRDENVDELLAGRDLLVVAADADSALASAALADAAALGLNIHAAPPQPPGPARVATLAGLRGPRLDILLGGPRRAVASPHDARQEGPW
jgi:hypothetical protein